MWRAGFKSGALVAQLFRDVPDALAEWRNAGALLFVCCSLLLPLVLVYLHMLAHMLAEWRNAGAPLL